MKILAVRGENLASLEGFEIDFREEWLGDAGLFAITGPTGAGKSTILDAIAVALFDQTPRLQGRSGVKITPYGDDAITSNDPRILLRKGTGEGFAEVEFLGLDGVAYRARWSARRANSSATGRLQPQKTELWELQSGDDLTESTKTLTLESIQEKVGLTFEQFCRSAMLAQGDFAAFLKAGETSRAELLEKMTDTGIYSRISMAAHERERTERSKVDRLADRLEGYKLMTEAQRSTAQAWHEAAKNRLGELVRNLTLTEVKLRWHERHDELKERVARAKGRVEKGERKWDELEDERTYFEAVREVNPLRVAHLTLRNLEARLEAARKSLEKAEKRSEDFEEREHALAKKLETAKTSEQAAEASRKDASGKLKDAREIDTKIAQKSEDIESLNQEVAQARDALDQTRERLEKLAERVEANEDARSKLTAWLESNRATGLVAAEWGLYERLLTDFATAQDTSEALTSGIDDHASVINELTREYTESRERLEDATKALDSIQEEVKQLGEASPADTLRVERQREELHREHLDAVIEARGTAESLIESRERLASLEGGMGSLKDQADELGERRKVLELNQVSLQSALDEARKSEQRWTAALDLESQRVALEDDSPCPLCGSLEHPWAEQIPDGVVAELEAQREHVAELENKVSTVKDGLSRNDERHRELSLKRQQKVQELEATQSKLEKLKDQWTEDCDRVRKVIATAPIEPDVSWNEATVDDDTLEALDAHRSLLDESLESIKGTLKNVSETMQRLEKKRGEVERRRQNVEEARKDLNEIEAKQRKLEQTLQTRRDELARLQKDQHERVQQLDPAFGGLVMWPMPLRKDPEAFLDRWRKDVEIWRENSKTSDSLQTAYQALEKEHEALRVRRDQQKRLLEAHTQKLEKRSAELEDLQRSRSTYFDGAPADRVERELEQALAAARRKTGELKDTLSKLESDRAANMQSLKDSRKQIEELEADITPRFAALNERMEELDIDREELSRRLERDESWLEEQREVIDAARDELSSAREVLKDRSEELEDHENGDSPDESMEEIHEQTKALKNNQEAANRLLNFAGQTLEIDRQARREVAEVQEQVEVQRRQHEIWKRLKDLIGSATGDVFRKYAQSLTLEVLLGYANDHLQNLKPRYVLQRVPKARLSLQVVDREMGDDIRSIESLSGGETFLVSLALALGLSSLTSNRTRIESLFIDEGFGSLDSESLNDAISTLETLQAQGRTIGLISHVPGLAELIGNRVEVVPRGDGRSTLKFHGNTDF